jgi:hypothetical protein
MPTNNYTTGKDVQLVIQTQNGPLQLALTDFNYKARTTTITSTALDGETNEAYIPRGYDLSLKIDRVDTTVDDFWAQYEAAYLAGVNQLPGVIYETISEATGNISEWQFNGVVIKVDGLGDFAGDKKVEQTLSGFAKTRVRVA